jgi:hypothetical protein
VLLQGAISAEVLIFSGKGCFTALAMTRHLDFSYTLTARINSLSLLATPFALFQQFVVAFTRYAFIRNIGDYSRPIILFLRKLFQEGLNDLICCHIFCFRLKVEQTAVTKCW